MRSSATPIACRAWLALALLSGYGCHRDLQSVFVRGTGSHDAATADDDAGSLEGGGVVALGEPCSVEDARACAGERQPLMCNARAWQLDEPCESDELCDDSAGATAGRCILRHDFSRGALSGDGATTCAIDAGGGLHCWGPPLGEPSAIADGDAARPQRLGSESWRAVAVSAAHACAVREDGSLWCWGSNCSGQLGVPEVGSAREPVRVGSESRWASVAVGGNRSCAIDAGGMLACWGGAPIGARDCSRAPDSSWSLDTSARDVRQVSISGAAVHVLQRDGSLRRLLDLDGTLGAPQPIGRSTFRVIDSGPDSVCGIREDGALACVDDASTSERTIDERKDWGGAIAVYDHVCATRSDGTLWCFGNNRAGQLGNGSVAPEIALPAQVGTAAGWVAVTARSDGSCGVRGARLYCWGRNRQGELGIGDRPWRSLPAQVGRERGWSRPTLGRDFSCAMQDQTLRCWGSNELGQLGSAGGALQLAPMTLAGRWLDARAGALTLCAIDGLQALWCWGELAEDGGLAASLDGVQVAALGSGEGTCAITQDGTAWCASLDGASAPVAAIQDLDVRVLASSGLHTCAITVAGSLHCWGSNLSGQLGIGTTSTEEGPIEVAGGGSWLAISVASNGCSCAITDAGATGRLFCWGSGAQGCLGDGGEQPSTRPQQVGSDSDWTRVSVGTTRACAVSRGGALFCWGSNADGGLGVGSVDTRLHEPERIGPMEGWADVAVSSAHTCAVTRDGTLWCWGTGAAGELGEGSAERLLPTQVAP